MTRPDTTVLPMRGIEPESLLAFLSVAGLLRALEAAKPEWCPRVSWAGPPWRPRLHIAGASDEATVAKAAADGIDAIVERFDVDERHNVDFSRDEFRSFLLRTKADPVRAALAAALAAEHPEKRAGGIQASPLVFMFGQGHQNFLDRLRAVPRGDLPKRLQKRKPPPDLRDPAMIRAALFAAWRREDDADAFRWDPEENQQYALRFDDPSSAGAAPTVHGANRLAALGFLTYRCAPGVRRVRLPGYRRSDYVEFVWPVWSAPIPLSGVEALLAHPDVIEGKIARVRSLGVLEIYAARRVSNGKFMNVTWAQPSRDVATSDRSTAASRA